MRHSVLLVEDEKKIAEGIMDYLKNSDIDITKKEDIAQFAIILVTKKTCIIVKTVKNGFALLVGTMIRACAKTVQNTILIVTSVMLLYTMMT